MDLDEPNNEPSTSAIPESVRSVMCEVCAKNEAKYTCPRCEVRTCCLECVKIHKKELDCNGLRDKVKFKRVTKFNNIDLLNDYRLLEETARVVSKSVKLPPVSCFNPVKGMFPPDLYRLRSAAFSRGIHLHFLPPSFSRHETNTTFLDQKTQELFWRVDWIFPQAGNISFTDERVLDLRVLSSCVHKYMKSDGMIYPALSFYQSAGYSSIKLLLKAERTPSNRYYLLDPFATLRANLSGKHIIEYPVIYVVLNDHIHSFNVFTEEEEQLLHHKSRRRHYHNKNKPMLRNNFLFGENTEVVKEEQSASEDIPVTDPASTSYDSPNYPHHRRRNFGRGRGHRRQFGRGNNYSSKRDSIGRLSKNLKSVHI